MTDNNKYNILAQLLSDDSHFPLRVSIFDGETKTRGTLPPKQTLEGFYLGESIPVNEKLSEIFLQLHISEKSGRGIPKIIETYGKNAIEFRENSIVVTIPLMWLGIKIFLVKEKL